MVGRSFLTGFVCAGREWRLVLLLWVSSLVLAVVAVVPAAMWWSTSLGPAVEAGGLLHRFDVAVLADLIDQDGGRISW